MKKLSHAFTLALIALLLAANLASCTQEKPSDPDEKKTVDVIDDQKDSKKNDADGKKNTNDQKQDDKKPDETALSTDSIEKAIADAVGEDNYLCNIDIEKNWLENYYGFDMSKIEEYTAKQNAVSSVNLDTVLVLKVADGYADTAVELLNKSFDQTVSYVRQYPFGVAKVTNARIYKEGNYVLFVLAGASYDGDDAEEEEKLAVSEYEKIDASLSALFGEKPENLAVVPEDDGSSGGFDGGLILDDDDMDGIILGG